MDMEPRRQINPEKVVLARQESGLKKYEAADAAGLSRPGYHRWEAVERGPLRVFDAYKLKRLCARLGVAEDALTDPIDEEGNSLAPQPDAEAQAVAS